MNLSPEDIRLLEELCRRQDISFEKVIKMLKTVKEFEFKERRAGIYEALRVIIKAKEDNENG